MSTPPEAPPAPPTDEELRAAVEALRQALTDAPDASDDDLRLQLEALADSFLKRFLPDGRAER